MKWLICMKLASYLRMRPSSKPDTPPAVGNRKNSMDAVNFQNVGQQPAGDTKSGTTDQLLMVVMEIRDMLRSQNRKAAEEREMCEEDEDKKNDWKLAAAAVDRMFFITFSVLFVGGTLIFSVTFSVAFLHVISM